MATKSSLKRRTEASGDDVVVWRTEGADYVQSSVAVDAEGDLLPSATGLSTYKSINVIATTGAVVASSPSRLVAMALSNAATAARYVKLYDKATAPSSSDTPKLTIRLGEDASRDIFLGEGALFTYGIGIRATTGVADDDNNDPTTNDVLASIFYSYTGESIPE